MEINGPLKSDKKSEVKGLFSGSLPQSPTLRPMEDLNDSMSSFQLSPSSSIRSGLSHGTFNIKLSTDNPPK